MARDERDPSKDHASWSWEPGQVPPYALGTSGSICSGLTCTMADGTVWAVANALVGYDNTSLTLGLTQQGK